MNESAAIKVRSKTY